MIGLRNIAQMKNDFRELLFYDIDRPIGSVDVINIDALCKEHNLSYILFSTKHGAHFICLTPLTPSRWAINFEWFKSEFRSYYSGKTIRVSRKKEEVQTVVKCVTTYGEVIPNLYNLYASRFGYEKMEWIRETSKYILHFERYKSFNE